MSSRNRERKAANREKRAAHEEAMRRRARRQRWIFGIGGLLLAGIVAFVVVSNLGDDNDDQVVADDTSTPTSGALDSENTTETSEAAPTSVSTETTVAAPAEGSVAGQPCVAVSEPLPEGAPDVPVQVGPPPTELVVEDLVVGDGAEVTEGAEVTVNYIGVACSTGAIFDESYSAEPVTFGLDAVIPGWTEGLVGMKVGGQRLLGIPPELAYGSQPNGDKIAADETLWFVVDMIETTPAG